MVQFGQQIQEALRGRFADCKDDFVRYAQLKATILRIEENEGTLGLANTNDSDCDTAGDVTVLQDKTTLELRESFFSLLDDDIGRLQYKTSEFMKGLTWKIQLEEAGDNEARKKEILINAFDQIQCLWEFCQLNYEGVRKIAKKYDKRCIQREEDRNTQEKYIQKMGSCNFGKKDFIDVEYYAIVEEYAKFFDNAILTAVQELEKERTAMNGENKVVAVLMAFVNKHLMPIQAPDTKVGEMPTTDQGEPDYLMYFANFVYLFSLIYFFCVGLGLMSNSFKIMSGPGLDAIVSLAENPVAGLMVGIFATVMVQSSSTSTSIAVAMVGSGVLKLEAAIPMIMGANIGTSVTSTIVALGHMDNPLEMRRAFAAATVHDMFNFFSVCIIFPIEVITGFLRWWVGELSGPLGGGGRGGKYTGPLKYITSPLLKAIAAPDKKKIKDASLGKKVSGSFIKGGLFKDSGASDGVMGFLLFIIAIVLICTCLILLVKFLRYLVGATAQATIRTAFSYGACANIAIGMLITVSVQSSSITTSTLVPLAATNLILLEQMFPIVLGANIGTTCTALLAALAVDKVEGLELALCHLWFNLFGILMIYPMEQVRAIPLSAARFLGREVEQRYWIALVYLFYCFFFVPGTCLAFSSISGAALGVWVALVLIFTLSVVGARYLTLNPKESFCFMNLETLQKFVNIEPAVSDLEQKDTFEMEGDLEKGGTLSIKGMDDNVVNYRPADLGSRVQ